MTSYLVCHLIWGYKFRKHCLSQMHFEYLSNVNWTTIMLKIKENILKWGKFTFHSYTRNEQSTNKQKHHHQKKKNPTTGIVTRFCQGVENKWQKLILVGMIMDNKHSEAVLFYSYTSLDCLVFYFSSALVISSPTASFFELLKRMFAGW